MKVKVFEVKDNIIDILNEVLLMVVIGYYFGMYEEDMWSDLAIDVFLSILTTHSVILVLFIIGKPGYDF